VPIAQSRILYTSVEPRHRSSLDETTHNLEITAQHKSRQHHQYVQHWRYRYVHWVVTPPIMLALTRSGLGNMGYGMACNMRKNMPSSQTLHIYDISSATCSRFVKENSHYGPITVESSAKNLATNCRTLVSMVPADQHVQAAYFDPSTGVIAAPPNPDRLMLDCSTIDIEGSKANGKRLEQHGSGTYIDCPVSGGVYAANRGCLSFMVGYPAPTGDDLLAQCILDTLLLMGDPEKIRFCGAQGLGLVAKIAANYICISNLLVAAEGMALGMKYGMDKKVLWDSIQDGAGQSWVMHYEQPVPGIVDDAPSSRGYERAFAARLGLKDLKIGVKAMRIKGVEPTAGLLAIEAFEKVDKDPRTTVSHAAKWL
jgi:3-hydroxyisobutyrate/3-hydroxypropionate dehydrogenase